jgi:hypothetical protein
VSYIVVHPNIYAQLKMTEFRMTTKNRAPHPQIVKAILSVDTTDERRRLLVDQELAYLLDQEKMLDLLNEEYELQDLMEEADNLRDWYDDIQAYRSYVLKLLPSDIPL